MVSFWEGEAERLTRLVRCGTACPEAFGNLRRAAIIGAAYGSGMVVQMVATLRRLLEAAGVEVLGWAVGADGRWVLISGMAEQDACELSSMADQSAVATLGGDPYRLPDEGEREEIFEKIARSAA